jgi:hypothetical protein
MAKRMLDGKIDRFLSAALASASRGAAAIKTE